MPISYWCII